MPISPRRRIEYAKGYLALGMIKDARREIDAISEKDQTSLEVQRVKVDLGMAAEQWAEVVPLAQALCQSMPFEEGPWIAWAFALHELKRTREAQEVLLRAEPMHGANCAVLHYNLACYACVLGDIPEAKRRLAIAFKMDAQWQEAAQGDPDLKAIRDQITGIK